MAIFRLSWFQRRQRLEESHKKIHHKENNLDPDDRNSLLCSACMLPIFSTQVVDKKINDNETAIFLHNQCSNLPDKLPDNVLHPGKPLILLPNKFKSSTSIDFFCNACKSRCGSVMYTCPDYFCSFQLDVKCAVTVRILHRSHEHMLAATRGSASFICGACRTQHQGLSSMFYLCNACDFWIHPDCASLPNAINLQESHIHPLLLTYALPEPFDQDVKEPNPSCNICQKIIQNCGVYFCNTCSYYAHIKCATSNRFTPGRQIIFELNAINPNINEYSQLVYDLEICNEVMDTSFLTIFLCLRTVLIREAKLANLGHFPMIDECASVVRYIMDDTSSATGGTCSNSTNDHDTGTKKQQQHPSIEGELFQDIHEHPLIYHDHDDDDDDDDDDDQGRVCNACIQIISPPFYSCSRCKDFFLHNCCAHLPDKFPNHEAHKKHSLLLSTKTTDPFNSKFLCSACMRHSNGFSYSCNICDFHLDVLCAFMPSSITHDAHGKSHILYISRNMKETCHCCRRRLGVISYECSNCLNFKLHAKCALFPDTVSHKFDPHPLRLTTPTISSQDQELFCEICEQHILTDRWYYNCDPCEQSFHINCIPVVDGLSKMKLGVTIYVECHDCPVTSIRAVTVDGYRCGYCDEVINSYYVNHEIAFECARCYFRIHEKCAKKCFINDA